MKQTTMPISHAKMIIGSSDGTPYFKIVNDEGKNLFSGPLDPTMPDELVHVAMAMREILEAAK